MTLKDKVNAIEHEIMMNEELISRDDVIELIARKHLSKEENFHGAITRLNMQVKALKPITIKAELAEILDKISAEIKGRIADCKHGEEIVGDDFGIFAVSIQVYSNVLEIIEKYKGVNK